MEISSTLLSSDGSRVISKLPQLIDRWKKYFSTLMNAITDTEKKHSRQNSTNTTTTRTRPSTNIGRGKSDHKQDQNEQITWCWRHTRWNLQVCRRGVEPKTIPTDGRMLAAEDGAAKVHGRFYLAYPWEQGTPHDCGNYRGISFLAISGKIMSKIVQVRLSKLPETMPSESQCGFRKEGSTNDTIFSLRQIQEKANM